MSTTMELIGTQLGRYSLVEHLATGGMAEIFLARQESLGKFKKDLVLKVLQTRWEEYPEVVEMFLDEARISALMNHPNIVDVFDVAEQGGRHFIAMEHIAGRTLAELAKRAIQVTKSISIEVGSYIAAEVASALAYMYDGNGGIGEPFRVVHRDISPGNVLISSSGQVKLIDFGIARQGVTVTQDAGTRPGKFTYMSPEQVKGVPIDGRSDIFCLGTILYEITLGRRLWRGPRELALKRIVEERPKPPTFIRRDYPTELELIVMRALEKKPEDRYQSAVELHNDLQGFLAQSNAHLRSHFHMADYVGKIFSEEAEALISESGRRRAQEFADGSEGSESGRQDLDFDAGQTTGPGAALARALRASALGVWAEAVPAPAPEPPPQEPPAEVAKTEVAEASEAKVEKAQPQDTKVETVKVARKQDGPAAARAVKAPSNATGQSASSRASRRDEPADSQPDRLPRRWAPILVAAIVMVAAAGAVWWLGGP